MTANKAEYKLFHSLGAAGSRAASPHLIRPAGTRGHLTWAGKVNRPSLYFGNKTQTPDNTPPRSRHLEGQSNWQKPLQSQ